MDPAKEEEDEECQSSSESGWTMYLGSPGRIDQHQQQSHTFSDDDDDDDDDGDGDGYHDGDDGGDDNDSVASDASSGPSNHHPLIKGDERTKTGVSNRVHGEEDKRKAASDEEKKQSKARAHSEQHVMVKTKGPMGDGRRRKKEEQQQQQQLPYKASSYY